MYILTEKLVLGQNTSGALIIVGPRWRRIKALKGNKFQGGLQKPDSLRSAPWAVQGLYLLLPPLSMKN